ncbi:hypothetical protein OB905_11360 [Halobacteria archaeon AArc-dxtr1]|nr:hypothetical protein [Halobacteria archaeon AArc-dxtr1]
MTDTDTMLPTVTIATGAALAVIGVAAYVLSDFASMTALIPALFGILFVILGAVAREPERRRISTYGIAVLALLGISGSAQGLPDIIELVTGGSPESTLAAVTQGTMIIAGAVLLVAAAVAVTNDR